MSGNVLELSESSFDTSVLKSPKPSSSTSGPSGAARAARWRPSSSPSRRSGGQGDRREAQRRRRAVVAERSGSCRSRPSCSSREAGGGARRRRLAAGRARTEVRASYLTCSWEPGRRVPQTLAEGPLPRRFAPPSPRGELETGLVLFREGVGVASRPRRIWRATGPAGLRTRGSGPCPVRTIVSICVSASTWKTRPVLPTSATMMCFPGT